MTRWRCADRPDLAHPEGFDPDEPALDFAAEILGGASKDSRLKRRLIHDQKLVVELAASNSALLVVGRFAVRAYALPGVDPEAIETAIREEMGKLASQPPSHEEMERVRRAFYNHAYSRVETVLGKAEVFNHYLLYQGELRPDSFLNELKRYEAVQPEDVCRVVSQYLSSPAVVVKCCPKRPTNGGPLKTAIRIQPRSRRNTWKS